MAGVKPSQHLPQVASKNKKIRRLKWTEELEQKCIDVMMEKGTKKAVIDALEIDYHRLNKHLRENKGFAEAFLEAEEYYVDTLEEEIHRRAVTGYEEPVFGKEGQIGTIKRYSDRLLEVAIKGRRDKYRNNFNKSGVDGSNVGVIVIQSPGTKTAKDWANWAGATIDNDSGEVS